MFARMIARASALATSLIALSAVIGCGGGGNDAQTADARRGTAAPVPAAPQFDAPPREVAEYVSGDWLVTLLPEVGDATQLTPPTTNGTLRVGQVGEGYGGSQTAALSGDFAGGAVGDGTLNLAADGSRNPRVRFTTGSLAAEGLAGEQITLDGPITWTGQLYQGRLVGTATGPDGRGSAWEASRR